jgi:hypothetical protein
LSKTLYCAYFFPTPSGYSSDIAGLPKQPWQISCSIACVPEVENGSAGGEDVAAVKIFFGTPTRWLLGLALIGVSAGKQG